MPTCRLATACSGFFAKCSALEAVAAGAVLAALASDLRTAACTASTKAFVILDGTLLPIDRIAADRSFYSGIASARRTSRKRSPRSGGPEPHPTGNPRLSQIRGWLAGTGGADRVACAVDVGRARAAVLRMVSRSRSSAVGWRQVSSPKRVPQSEHSPARTPLKVLRSADLDLCTLTGQSSEAWGKRHAPHPPRTSRRGRDEDPCGP